MMSLAYRATTMATSSARTCKGSECVTHGIRITVEPRYLPSHSDPDTGRYLFNYKVVMHNEGQSCARLRSRKWVIVDSAGEQHEVQGLGVVGHHPNLSPGDHFEYSSFCPLQTAWGTMQGTYVMERDDGSLFEVEIARFFLIGPHQ